jgi:hypothetical protein
VLFVLSRRSVCVQPAVHMTIAERVLVTVTIGDLARSASLDGIGNPRVECLDGRVLIADC